jgi:hypothetical protein
LAPIAVPSVEPAPARFSTITGLPSRSESLGATTRATVSTAPPGAHGTIMVTGRDG